jgi:hypothetical protein
MSKRPPPAPCVFEPQGHLHGTIFHDGRFDGPILLARGVRFAHPGVDPYFSPLRKSLAGLHHQEADLGILLEVFERTVVTAAHHDGPLISHPRRPEEGGIHGTGLDSLFPLLR